MRLTSLLLVFLFFAIHVLAQQEIRVPLSIINSSSSDSLQLKAYRDIIDYYIPVNTDSAILYADNGLKYFTQKKYKTGEAWMFDYLGEIDDEHGRSDDAKEKLTQALILFTEVNDKKGQTEAQMDLGILNSKEGNFIEAATLFVEALKTFDSMNNNGGMMRACANLAIVNEHNSSPMLALEYLHRAEELANSLPLSDEVINLYNNIGGYYIDKGDTETAMKYMNMALKKSEKPEYTASHVSCLINMGLLSFQMGKLSEAKQEMYDALIIAKEKDMPEEQANILMGLAQFNSASNDTTALGYAKEALVIAKKIENKPLQADIYNIISEIYKKRDDYKNAIEARENRRNIVNSLYNNDKLYEIQNMSAMYELLKTNDKIKEMKDENSKIFKKLNIIITITIAFIIALSIALFYYRKLSLFNKQLSLREKELNESNEMKNKLFSIIGHDLRAPIARIPSIIEILEYEETSIEDRKYLLQNLLEHSTATLETLDKLLYWGQMLIKGVMIRQEVFLPFKYVQENIELKKKHAQEKNLMVYNNTDEHSSVCSDPQHFDFVIRNLLVNAIKYSKQNGTIIINADFESKPGFTIFSVKDDGIGMDISKLSSVFNAMQSTYGTANEKGNGIGLMLCKEFVMKNGGEIWAESEVDKGTTFFFTVKNTK